MPHATNPHVQEAIDADEHVKLILCFDGTGNVFSGTNADTNVVKILRKLDRNNKKQFHYYQTGIGTYDINESSVNKTPIGSVRSMASQAIDSGFGTTFDAHIMAGYRFLMRHYESEAKIYIFGFSRGAFTAKYLARMVNEVGLLCKGNEEMVPFAYRLYQRSLKCESDDRTAAAKGGSDNTPKSQPDGTSQSETDNLPQNAAPTGRSHGKKKRAKKSNKPARDSFLSGNPIVTTSPQTIAARKEVKAFSETFCRTDGTDPDPHTHKNIKVFFLGIWDCVNSVAVVERNAPAPVEVTGTAHHVRHAVAVDEHRVKFKPALLAQDIKEVIEDSNNKSIHNEDEEEDIREVWFPGNHGDIGGGWPAVPVKSPSEMAWWPRLKYFFSTMKPNDPYQILDDDALQMSDMALDWMIREVEIIGEQHPGCQVHWCHTIDDFKKNMKVAENVEKYVVKGFMHNCLKFGYGTSFFKVLMWNFIESLPGIPRWELNDAKDKEERGWDLYRGTPNFCASRDIPRGAILHNSLKERLEKVDTYRPRNSHGSGKPCLWNENGAVDMVERLGPGGPITKGDSWAARHRIWQLKDFISKSPTSSD
ncbi:hypothetical protein HG530_015098 [Fusarium avenaceum]|nr:hypothetical protein HG530_015098 [Fusarium avenaceum]